MFFLLKAKYIKFIYSFYLKFTCPEHFSGTCFTHWTSWKKFFVLNKVISAYIIFFFLNMGISLSSLQAVELCFSLPQGNLFSQTESRKLFIENGKLFIDFLSSWLFFKKAKILLGFVIWLQGKKENYYPAMEEKE